MKNCGFKYCGFKRRQTKKTSFSTSTSCTANTCLPPQRGSFLPPSPTTIIQNLTPPPNRERDTLRNSIIILQGRYMQVVYFNESSKNSFFEIVRSAQTLAQNLHALPVKTFKVHRS